MNLKQTGRYLLDLRNENKKRPLLEAGNISYANWWRIDPAKYWFTRFVQHYFPDCGENHAGVNSGNANGKTGSRVRFYSVFGPKGTINEPFDGVKVFFSGENLEEGVSYERLRVREISAKVWENRRRKFGDYAIGKADLSMGFPEHIDWERKDLRSTGVDTNSEALNRSDYTEGKSEKNSTEGKTIYLRFPLWITYLFEPEDDLDEIRNRIREINECANPVSSHGIACIASHDFFGTRTDICDCLEQAGMRVDYAGSWRHNTYALQADFGDDKVAYLHSKRFNICPENLDTKDYVTEKLFDAFRSGVIPIYHGSLNQPEPGLVNPDAVLLWNYRGEDAAAANRSVISRIHELETDDSAYLDFMRQTKIYDVCADYVWDRMQALRRALGDLPG